jgi:CRP-like cAMP-binding protein
VLPDTPSLEAIPFQRAELLPIQLLSNAQRARLARHATVHTHRARTVIYLSGAEATSVFIIDQGVVKSFRDLPSGRRRIAAFLFPRDVFGLAEAGRYVNTVQAITPVRLWEIELSTLALLFKDDADLQLQFLCKTVHVLREAQHHNIIIGRRDAVGRLAMFVALLLRQGGHARMQAEVDIPMTRSDIANYLGLSLEAVVRASRRLERQGLVEFIGLRRARILDRRRFEALAGHV